LPNSTARLPLYANLSPRQLSRLARIGKEGTFDFPIQGDPGASKEHRRASGYVGDGRLPGVWTQDHVWEAMTAAAPAQRRLRGAPDLGITVPKRRASSLHPPAPLPRVRAGMWAAWGEQTRTSAKTRNFRIRGNEKDG